LAVGTGNLIWRDAPRDPRGRLPPLARPLHGTREWWVFADRCPALAVGAGDRFERAWLESQAPPRRWSAAPAALPAAVGTPLPQVAPLIIEAPEVCARLVTGGASVAGAQLELIASARRRAYVTVPYVHPRVGPVASLLKELTRAASRGADARLLLGQQPAHEDAARLVDLGLRVRHMDADLSTRGHAKGVVVDRAVMVTSANWSAAGLGGNWEAGLVIRLHRAAAYYAAAFLRDWRVAARLEAG
jgi:phosphatidylserine/phosphatidylglycerophosphate/cardiolipin synthase-like enzyme